MSGEREPAERVRTLLLRGDNLLKSERLETARALVAEGRGARS